MLTSSNGQRSLVSLCAWQVMPQNGGYYCEFDGKTYERMERRYVLLVKAADATGETYLNMFNEQVRQTSCCHARAMPLRTGGP